MPVTIPKIRIQIRKFLTRGPHLSYAILPPHASPCAVHRRLPKLPRFCALPSWRLSPFSRRAEPRASHPRRAGVLGNVVANGRAPSRHRPCRDRVSLGSSPRAGRRGRFIPFSQLPPTSRTFLSISAARALVLSLPVHLLLPPDATNRA